MTNPKTTLSRHQTSWKPVGDWYDSIVGEKGHFYHREVILPNVLRSLALKEGDRLLDIGCGQGVLSRVIPKNVDYVGIDIAKPLLDAAEKYKKTHPHTSEDFAKLAIAKCEAPAKGRAHISTKPIVGTMGEERSELTPSRREQSAVASFAKASFIHADLTRPWPLSKEPPFTHAACILVLQNIEEPDRIFEYLAKALHEGGKAIFVLNHPYFRIPRQSRWNFDEKTKTQTRELFSYMTPQRIPIVTHPGKPSAATWSFHVPLSEYTAMSHAHGFVIETIDEWCSPKHSTGSAAKAENRARKEFPLFMAITFVRDHS